MARYLKRNDSFDFITSKSNSGVDLAIMDYALPCRGSECDIYGTCPYAEQSDICQIHRQYTNHIIKMVYRYDDNGKVNDHQLHVIGMTMMPLYTHLFRFQLAEMALNTPVVYGKTIYMHPIYKEIRNTTKLLFDMWAKMGMMGEPPMPERGSGASVYDLISAGEAAVDDSTSKQVKQKVDLGNLKEVEEAMEDSDIEYEEPPVKLNPAWKEKGRKARDKARNQMALMEEAAGLTIASVDGEEEIEISPDFDPRDLPNASEIDPESLK